jgi:hypothetical protein
MRIRLTRRALTLARNQTAANMYKYIKVTCEVPQGEEVYPWGITLEGATLSWDWVEAGSCNVK